MEHRARRPAAMRVARAIAIGMAALLLLLPLAVHLLLPREEVVGLASGGRPLHVLITGSDSRDGLSAEERIELTTGNAGGERTDTIMILTIDGSRAGLLSFPRDLSVTRCDGSVGRINGALAIGGPGCLVETIRLLSGITVHHHVQVTFGGFRDVVDAVGGVELCLEKALTDRSAGIDLPEGCQVLDGREALGFVRVRKIDSDFARVERQQRFIRALAGELLSPGLLVQPWRLVPAVLGVARAVTVDDRMNPIDIARVAMGLRALGRGDVVTATVPAVGFRAPSGAALLRVREEEAAVLFEGFANGELLRSGGGGTG